MDQHADVIDVEEYGKRGENPPVAPRYRIRIDKTYHTVEQSSMTGRAILGLVGKTPEGYYLDEKVHGAPPVRIAADEVVEFAKHKTERFTETEGGNVSPSSPRSEI
jgi:hypothetical protein